MGMEILVLARALRAICLNRTDNLVHVAYNFWFAAVLGGSIDRCAELGRLDDDGLG
jgi:hypothetical protein